MSERLHWILRDFAERIETYSIDECFLFWKSAPLEGWSTLARRIAETVRHAGGRAFRLLGTLRRQLVEFLLGLFLVLTAFGETESLSAEGDHPPADIFAEPDFVGTRHCQISGQKSLEKKARPQGLARAALG
jgi:hypothetical protein